MGTDIEHGELVDDRPLTGVEKQRLERGHDLAVGNGSWTNFDQLPPETLAAYRRKAVETRRLNAESRKLAQRLAYIEAHKEHAATILGVRLSMIEGLAAEMVNPKTGKPDTRLLDEKRLKVLQTALNDFDKGMGMQPSAEKDTQRVDVNVTHTVAQLVKSLGGGA